MRQPKLDTEYSAMLLHYKFELVNRGMHKMNNEKNPHKSSCFVVCFGALQGNALYGNVMKY